MREVEEETVDQLRVQKKKNITFFQTQREIQA
jgi:hypothetical protein